MLWELKNGGRKSENGDWKSENGDWKRDKREKWRKGEMVTIALEGEEWGF